MLSAVSPEVFYKKPRAASELNISTATLDRYVAAGKIPAFKLCGVVLFKPEDIERAKEELLSPKPLEVCHA